MQLVMNRRNTLVLLAVIVSVMLWGYRYRTLNGRYIPAGDTGLVVSKMHQKVAFGENSTCGGEQIVDGYEICVNEIDIKDYFEVAEISVLADAPTPDKIVLVSVTLSNKDSDAEGVMLTDLQLHGIDQYVGMDWDLLLELNPVLKTNYGIHLEKGRECNIILPYQLYRQSFGGYTWNKIDDYVFYLRLTTSPIEQRIILNE